MLGLNGVGRGPKVYAGAGPGSKLKRSRSARRRN